MKRLTLLLGTVLSLAGTAWAQTTLPANHLPPGGQVTITPEEWQELRAARAAAIKANPSFIAENAKLLARMRALEDKLDAAMIKADPTITPVIAKFEANRPRPGAPTTTAPAVK
jgi:hypothetical protein